LTFSSSTGIHFCETFGNLALGRFAANPNPRQPLIELRASSDIRPDPARSSRRRTHIHAVRNLSQYISLMMFYIDQIATIIAEPVHPRDTITLESRHR
jgi:hypothetical protein